MVLTLRLDDNQCTLLHVTDITITVIDADWRLGNDGTDNCPHRFERQPDEYGWRQRG